MGAPSQPLASDVKWIQLTLVIDDGQGFRVSDELILSR
jgi:hypothetical protein